MKYLLILFMAICSIRCAAQSIVETPTRQGNDSLPHLNVARLVAIDSQSTPDSLREYLLQQGWEYHGPIDNDKTISYWYDFNHYRSPKGDRWADHNLYIEVRKDRKTIAGIVYKTSSQQQYLDMQRTMKENGFRTSINRQHGDGSTVQTFIKEPVWIILEADGPQPDRIIRYRMTVEILK